MSLVERLRAEYPRTGAYAPEATCRHGIHPYDCRNGCAPPTFEAADEIERLRGFLGECLAAWEGTGPPIILENLRAAVFPAKESQTQIGTCQHEQVQYTQSGWACQKCMRLFYPSGDTGAERECVLLRVNRDEWQASAQRLRSALLFLGKAFELEDDQTDSGFTYREALGHGAQQEEAK